MPTPGSVSRAVLINNQKVVSSQLRNPDFHVKPAWMLHWYAILELVYNQRML